MAIQPADHVLPATTRRLTRFCLHLCVPAHELHSCNHSAIIHNVLSNSVVPLQSETTAAAHLLMALHDAEEGQESGCRPETAISNTHFAVAFYLESSLASADVIHSGSCGRDGAGMFGPKSRLCGLHARYARHRLNHLQQSLDLEQMKTYTTEPFRLTDARSTQTWLQQHQ